MRVIIIANVFVFVYYFKCAIVFDFAISTQIYLKNILNIFILKLEYCVNILQQHNNKNIENVCFISNLASLTIKDSRELNMLRKVCKLN